MNLPELLVRFVRGSVVAVRRIEDRGWELTDSGTVLDEYGDPVSVPEVWSAVLSDPPGPIDIRATRVRDVIDAD